jgi:nucleotide-binding universal stress UspA family protein
MLRQIIVPLDGSTLAEHALPHASAMARATSNSLVLLQVVPPGRAAEMSSKSAALTQCTCGHCTAWCSHAPEEYL